MKDDFLNKKLNERKQQNAYRELRLPDNKVDFCSNDYLGIVRNNLINNLTEKWKPKTGNLHHGSTGSRLLAGNYELIEETEKLIAKFHDAEKGLIFNSGYDANIGLLSCVPQRGDTIIYDYLSHASIRDGIRLSFAESFSFTHNRLDELEKKLVVAKGNIFVVTESVFSMDGDFAPLAEIADLCEKYNANLIVDEAHATGIVGEKGEGLVQHLNLQKKCFARIHTFGKAVGCHGAIVLGSELLRDFLINFSRTFIYTTALPDASVAVIKDAYGIFPELNLERNHLKNLIAQFQNAVIAFEKLKSFTPIQVVIIPGNDTVKKVAQHLQENNFDVRPIVYPTVPKCSERLRIVLHSFNTVEDIDELIRRLND
jgi:8-amino-7-oxononanoate synthase